MLRKLLMIFAVLTASATSAQARVDILPHILVIEGRERTTELTILNLSEELNRYGLKVIHYRQNEDGTYKILEAPLDPLFDPEQIARISPKEFTLEGGGRQKIRIAMRKPSDLPEKEYRFHLVATGYEIDDPKAPPPPGDISVSMKINVGVAIPVIIRHGDLSATGKLKDFNLKAASQTESGKPELAFTATREGNSSTLGRVEVAWAPDGQNYKDIGFITNFNLFTEITERYGAVPLDVFPSGGSIRILYTDTESKEIYDEIILDR